MAISRTTSTCRLALLAAIAALSTLAPTTATAATVTSAAAPAGANLAPAKRYLLQHTAQLTAFTKEFRTVANRYYAAARATGFDYDELAATKRTVVARDLARAKALWIEGNPYYERVEGVVAGTPSLAVYDVILDAGSSAKEDPASAVPFDLKLRNGKVLRKPGNLYNLTEGMLWGTRPELVAAKVDLDGDGRVEFGEVLPDANALAAAADAFVLYGGKLDRAARSWQPTASDAFTSVVVMVPTMSEYFGQWKVSRFVLGDQAKGDSFNVVSRLSDIGDILGGLRVIYAGIGPAIAKVDPQQHAQTKRELDALWSYVANLRAQEKSGKRFRPQQADTLGRTAQERATAIAGQVTQAAARLRSRSRSRSVRRLLILGVVTAAGLWLAAAAFAGPPWQDASTARLALTDAEAALAMGDSALVRTKLLEAREATDSVLADRPAELAVAASALARADAAGARLDDTGLAAARATVWTAILRAGYAEAVDATRRGEPATARAWLLVREFRPPTRFSRAAADATLALDRLAQGSITPGVAAASVSADLLDTYDGRIRVALTGLAEAEQLGFAATRAEAGAAALGYWAILQPAYRKQRGVAAARATTGAIERLAVAARDGRGVSTALARVDQGLEGFRAAPLSEEETLHRAGQLDRFLRLVAIEYGRGVSNGRVTKDFEIQEAITFRDGAAAAFADLEAKLLARDPIATRRVKAALAGLGADLVTASHGGAAVAPDTLGATVDAAVSDLDKLYPAAWKDAAETADFDVIAAALDRMQAAAASGDWGAAESARIEAYGIFELGPEQRLRGLAPSLFQGVESLFWYGTGDQDGLVRLIKRKATTAELATARAALDASLVEAEQRIGTGPGSRFSIVSNSAIIVFREGLEAVLILAALMASMVGAQRRYRRPLLGGVALALVASAITWVVAQTVLGSLARYGEKLEAVVSLVAIAVLLLILNWFYHRVYWQENLQSMHRKKKSILQGAGLSLAAAQVAGLVALGFTSVYREGFETTLFLQALTLEAGAWTVLQGVAIGLAATFAVGVLVFALERKLPHKKMLVVTGVMITWVLVVLVGQTVQVMQKVGWVPVTPIEGLELPYSAGVWLGLYPTWEGILAQAAAGTFVIGSYFAAETVRRRRRARILSAPIGAAHEA